MNPFVILLCFAVSSLAAIVVCDLRDPKTHRWKPARTRRQWIGYAIVLLAPVAMMVTMLLTR